MNFKLIISIFLINSLIAFAQPMQTKITVSGKVLEKGSNLPLEYATIVLQNTKTNQLSGGITDENGNFKFEVLAGNYTARVEYISFKNLPIKQTNFNENIDLGTLFLEPDVAQLNEAVVIAEKSTVEIKLDKKVYNVGRDMMVKGGNASDVLDNVPSVAVDAEGTITLRGNEDVRVLIDGKPSGLAGINVSDALKMLPAEAIEKVEVVTNPSARYDAEGGGGIINIILRKGKTNGFNGVLNTNTGYPDNHGISANVNYKTNQFNIFTTQGFNYRNNPGNAILETEYLNNVTNATEQFVNETRNSDRINRGYNGILGAEFFITNKTSITNTLTYSFGNNNDFEHVNFKNYDANFNLVNNTNRDNNTNSTEYTAEFATNITHKIKGDEHKINLDFFSNKNNDNDNNFIYNDGFNNQNNITKQKQRKTFLQFDYINHTNEKHSFEMGYRGDFSKNTNDFYLEDLISGIWTNNTNFSNIFNYKEYINALYAQYGTKYKKISLLAGLRWEDSNIYINESTSAQTSRKKYNNFFPSLFITYQNNEKASTSLSYSRRIRRPRGRMLNPFSNLSSTFNVFKGNPDLDPAMTHAIDLSYLHKFDKLTVTSSIYYNYTKDPFQFTRRNSGLLNENNLPIIYTGPVNLGNEDRLGFEFTLNYNPFKWWRLNHNFNIYRVTNNGEYNYVGADNIARTINLNNEATTWFTRLNSKITLPKKIDWQTNFTYNGPQKTAQGKVYGIASVNLAFSKDVLKDKGTIAFNVSDLFNSRKRIFDANIPYNLNSHTEFQWRERQFTLSFTYRFNRNKEREKQRREDGGGDGEFM